MSRNSIQKKDLPRYFQQFARKIKISFFCIVNPFCHFFWARISPWKKIPKKIKTHLLAIVSTFHRPLLSGGMPEIS